MAAGSWTLFAATRTFTAQSFPAFLGIAPIIYIMLTKPMRPLPRPHLVPLMEPARRHGACRPSRSLRVDTESAASARATTTFGLPARRRLSDYPDPMPASASRTRISTASVVDACASSTSSAVDDCAMSSPERLQHRSESPVVDTQSSDYSPSRTADSGDLGTDSPPWKEQTSDC